MKALPEIKILLIALAAFLGGCASVNQDLLKEQRVVLETTPVDDVTYLYTNVEQKGVKVYVFGRVALKDPKTAFNAPGHIDISIVDANGTVLWIDHAPYKQYHHSGRRNQVQYNSSARILVDEGTIVRLTHHSEEISVHDHP